ncbi:hypothetical protein C4K27_3113 [Pseudomonas chlororaphis subsp. chlororaphis]|nr:hypothetical protein C4K27_3113 [Pseudomonas chlororaphis subsp. chlororaphis]
MVQVVLEKQRHLQRQKTLSAKRLSSMLSAKKNTLGML